MTAEIVLDYALRRDRIYTDRRHYGRKRSSTFLLKMQSLVVPILALCAPFAVLAEQRAQFVVADGDILLKLDYATHRGVYNKTNEVNLSYLFGSSAHTVRYIRFGTSATQLLPWEI
jgi:hypothetical protein